MVIKGAVDDLQMYLGADYQVTDQILIHQPTVAEVAEFGEQRYYSSVFSLTAIPSDMKYQLEDMGFNYMKVADYDLFLLLSRTLTPESTGLLLGDLDLSQMELMKDEQTGEPVLFDMTSGAKIDRSVYLRMVDYLRRIHAIVPKIENAANETTRKILIQLDRDKAAKAAKTPYKSQLKMIISGLMRTPTCAMSLAEITALPLTAFMDAIMGAQVFVATNALLIGANSGMVDTSKISKKHFDWMRDAKDDEKRSIVNDKTTGKNTLTPSKGVGL